jgi:hypothetical protein
VVFLLTYAVTWTTWIAAGAFPGGFPGATDPFALSTSLVAWLTVALLRICAGYFLVRMSKPEAGPLTATIDRVAPAR